MLVDAVSRVTGVAERLGDRPPGTSAGSLGDSRVASEPLDLLGRCRRESGCTSDVAAEGSLALALHAINGPWLNAKLADPGGRVRRMVRAGRSDGEIVAELYRVALGRGPTDDELAHWTREIAAAGAAGRLGAIEDFAWALLLSPEFTRNH